MSVINKNSKIFIAGHNGMVGSAAVRLLSSRGYKNIFANRRVLDLRNQAKFLIILRKLSQKGYYMCTKAGGIQANNDYKADFIYDNLMIQTNLIHASYLSNVKT